ncbi:MULTISPECIES: hypothetical protein [unclassified Streptomyces]|uniref:hypothetical protein n=1 Tax=unclassified Streptomyces TaxID=2593676 RepID=UPI0033A19418
MRRFGPLCATSPRLSRTMQSPQFPTVQEYGIGSPAARPASRSVWPGSTTAVPTGSPSRSTVIRRGTVVPGPVSVPPV